MGYGPEVRLPATARLKVSASGPWARGQLHGGGEREGGSVGHVQRVDVGHSTYVAASARLIGVAVLGTVFFSAIGLHPNLGVFVDAAREIAFIALGLNAAAFAVGFLLPNGPAMPRSNRRWGRNVRKPELVPARRATFISSRMILARLWAARLCLGRCL